MSQIFSAHSTNIFQSEAVVPNTNRHAMEGSNPVWMTGVGYDNWEVEGEEQEEVGSQTRPGEGRVRGEGRMWKGIEHGFMWICVDFGLGPGNKK